MLRKYLLQLMSIYEYPDALGTRKDRQPRYPSTSPRRLSQYLSVFAMLMGLVCGSAKDGVGQETVAYRSVAGEAHQGLINGQCTTGPTPPQSVFQGYPTNLLDYHVLIPGVPTYLWYRGCGPTVAAMLLGYWDGRGFQDLIPGDASTQTAAVNTVIASDDNYNDYCLPIDTAPDPIEPDLSEPPAGDEHIDNCVSDFMEASQSASGNYFGWAWFSDMDDALREYVAMVYPQQGVVVQNLTWDDFSWERLCLEIDSGRPLIFLVDLDGDGFTDHFVTVFGYGEEEGQRVYGCFNSWDTEIHWYDFEPVAPGQLWGIYGATLFAFSPICVPDEYTTIQEAIDAASNGETIVVRPDSVNRGPYEGPIDFSGKSITLISETGAEETTIDGMQAGSVVSFNSMEGPTSVLEGFTLTNGTGTLLAGFRTFGGGIYCSGASPTLRSNIITGNEVNTAGAGVYCWAGSPTISGNVIIDNTVQGYQADGGGIYLSHPASSPVIINNLIAKNTVSRAGGGIYSYNGAAPQLANNTIYGNEAGIKGGGILFGAGTPSPAVVNSLLWANSAPEGAQIHVASGSPVVTYSIVQGGWPGTGNLAQDPLLNDPINQDFSLTDQSPCINRGTEQGAPFKDIKGDFRPSMSSVDIGAEEYTGIHLLELDRFTLEQPYGGTVNLYIRAGAGNAGKWYVIFGSTSGTNPGFPLSGAALPINWDGFTDLVLANLNTPTFSNFMGVTGGLGNAAAHLSPGPLPSKWIGKVMRFAYLLDDGSNFTSNPVSVEVISP